MMILKMKQIDDHHFSYFIDNFICITILMDVEINTSKENTCSFFFLSSNHIGFKWWQLPKIFKYQCQRILKRKWNSHVWEWFRAIKCTWQQFLDFSWILNCIRQILISYICIKNSYQHQIELWMYSQFLNISWLEVHDNFIWWFIKKF